MMELRKELSSFIFNSSCPSLGISISTSCDSSNSAEESIDEGERGNMLKTPTESRVDGGQDAGGQVQLLLDDRGVHLKLDSAGKRVDEGERKRG